MTIEDNTKDLMEAAYKGKADKVAQLIPVSDPLYDQSYALRAAAANGWIECVKLLIPVSDPLADNSAPLKWAAYYGHDNCVEFLLPFSNPKLGNSEALQCACRGRALSTRCIDLLIDESDGWAALYNLQAAAPDQPELWQYLEESLRARQKECLTREMGAVAPASKTRRI